MKKIILTLFVLFSALVLVACNVKPDEDRTGDKVSLTDKHGTREITVDPTRVAFLGLDALELIDSVGYTKLTDGTIKIAMMFKESTSLLEKYNTNDQVVSLGNHRAFDYDALDLFAPELLILGNRTSSWFDDLKTKYPNADIYDASHNISSGELVDTLQKNAAAFEAIFTDLDGKLTSKVNELVTSISAIKPQAKDKKALFIMVSGSEIQTYGLTSRFGMLYTDFGFTVADPNLSNEDAHGSAISYETIASLNPDVIYVLDRAAAADGSASAILQEFLANELVKGTIAGRSNDIYTLHNDAWYLVTGGGKATEHMIDDLLQYFNES